MRARSLIVCGLSALSLGVAACSEETSEESASEDGSAQTTQTNEVEQSSAEPRSKPRVTIPKGEPPNDLVVRDLKKGTGATAKAGSQVSVNYVGVAYSNGREFDNSYDRGQAFPFTLGGGQVIPGWDEGIQGMKVGGRRQLTIPPDLAYGAQGSPPAIGPNETLVFIVDLLSVK
jgi:peptidylprolyl isomerase